MKTAIPRGELEVLAERLEAALQRVQSRTAIAVQCALKPDLLMVLAQHQPDIAPNPRRVFVTLEHAVRQALSDSIEAIAPGAKTLNVHLYLRRVGQVYPYVTYGFVLRVEPVDDDAIHELFGMTAIAPEAQVNASIADAEPDLESDTESDAELDADPVGDIVRVSPPEEAREAELTPSLAPEERPPARLGRFRLPISALSLAAIAGLSAFIGIFYVLSRPCVIGACVPLQNAQRLERQAGQTMQATQTIGDVHKAYQDLTEASYMLGTIPRWSNDFETAQALLQRYETETKVLSNVTQALQQATEAAEASQNPPHPIDEWHRVQGLWQQAIALLERVPADHPIYLIAQQKLLEYQSNLIAINQRIRVEQEAQQKVVKARETARVAEAREGTANSVQSWQLTHSTWQVVVNLLQQIPRGTMARAEADQLTAIYQPRLAQVRDRRMQEEISARAYSQALQLAEQARQLEQQNQWSQAVSQWRVALENAQQVPDGTTLYGQAQPLINSFNASLEQAESRLQTTVGRQKARTDLTQICTGTPQVCTFTVDDTLIQVWITAAYDEAVQQAIANSQQSGDYNAQASVTAHINAFLQGLASVSETARLPVKVYNADGSLFGTYEPSFSGFVTR